MVPTKKLDIGRLLDKLVERVPNVFSKHPALTAGAIGTGIAASDMDQNARNMESLIMREQMGAPGSKYAGAVKKSAQEAYHRALKPAIKTSADSDWQSLTAGGAAKGVGSAVGSEGIGALKSLLRSLYLKAKDKTIQDPQREKIVSNLLTEDPVVSGFEQNTPGGAQQAFSTMKRWAPELSTDPNLVQSFLRQAALTGGAMDYPSLKSLTDAETSALRARKER